MAECELPIGPLLEYYGWDARDGSGWFTILCPFHQERNPSARVNLEINAFLCNGCSVKGNTVTIIMNREDINNVQAAIGFYAEATGQEADKLRGAVRGKSRPEVHQRPRPFERDSPLLSLGVDREPGTRRLPSL